MRLSPARLAIKRFSTVFTWNGIRNLVLSRLTLNVVNLTALALRGLTSVWVSMKPWHESTRVFAAFFCRKVQNLKDCNHETSSTLTWLRGNYFGALLNFFLCEHTRQTWNSLLTRRNGKVQLVTWKSGGKIVVTLSLLPFTFTFSLISSI